ncbi:MAG: sulfatase-like hydrolase/transferase [Planctomycetota bacterium]
MRQQLAAALLTVFGVIGVFTATAAAAERPNVIVIMADDLGAKELACYGHPSHQTPHLDQLAASGVKFETCYATPICHPTRFEIMTGQYGCTNGIYNFGSRRGGPAHDDPNENIANHMTFGQVFKQNGYATALAGKWQLSGKVPTLIKECGFDEYLMWAYDNNLPPGVKHEGGREGTDRTSRYFHPSLMKNGEYLPTKPDDYGPDMFNAFVLDFARKHRQQPFFVYYPMCLTHGPYYTTPNTTQSPDDRFVNKKENFASNVAYLDKLIGRLVAGLEEAGLRERTFILFTGDNGTGGDGKGQPTELGARVPMIVVGPGVKALGSSPALVDLSDVFPTILELAGIEKDPSLKFDGQSFAPVLRGEKEQVRDWIFSYIADRRIVRDQRWLLEDNSPLHYGRLYDCGASRNGEGYREVTESTDPEVLAVRKRFDAIIATKPAPVLDFEGPAAALNADQKAQKGGQKKDAGAKKQGGKKRAEKKAAEAGA